MTPVVKICGLSTPDTLDVALEAGADMVGFVFFPPSPRNISFQTARELSSRVQGRAHKVANTVDTPTAKEIGIPSAVRMMKARPRSRRTMAQSTLVPVIAAASGRTISSTISLKANTMMSKPLIGIAG